jgi:DNA-3-methyladenine glycosylase
MYDCLNVVTGEPGVASAVLLRAVAPLEGVAAMRAGRLAVGARRRAIRADPTVAEAAARRLERVPVSRLASGPGVLAAAFGLDRSWTGTDLCDPASALRLERDPADPADRVGPDEVLVTHRIGVDYAGPDWAGRALRFAIAGHPSVSGPPDAR